MSDVEDFKDQYGSALTRLRDVFEQHGLGDNRAQFLSVVALRLHSAGQLDLLGEDPELLYQLLERVVNNIHAQCVEEAVAKWEEENPLPVELSFQIVDEQIPGTDCPTPPPRILMH